MKHAIDLYGGYCRTRNSGQQYPAHSIPQCNAIASLQGLHDEGYVPVVVFLNFKIVPTVLTCHSNFLPMRVIWNTIRRRAAR
ncbi:hypothetical protein ES703_117679 [subsurface metagenome]